jgi:DNA polymerase V
MNSNHNNSFTIKSIAPCNETNHIPNVVLIVARVAAGFPSPAENYISQSLNLHDLVVEHPASTFFIRVKGDSMIGAGIHDNDIAVVDRSRTAAHNSIVIARIENEMTIKRLMFEKNTIILMPENPAYKPRVITAETDFEVWGVVTYIVHKV